MSLKAEEEEAQEPHMAAVAGGPCGVRSCFNYLIGLFTFFLVLLALSLSIKFSGPVDTPATGSRLEILVSLETSNTTTSTAKNESAVEELLESFVVYNTASNNSAANDALDALASSGEDKVFEENENITKCDLFSGNWVYDNSTGPMYDGLGCAFLHDEIACDKYGRTDSKYKGWQWRPHGCELPRFDAKKLLERLRGKRLVYVGDSLNRNQWVSMVCLVEKVIPESQKSINYNGSLWSFKAKEFNASIDFYWSPLLVESNCDDPYSHRTSERMMRNGSIEKHASNWDKAEIVVFNSYLWWKKPWMKMKVFDEWSSLEDANNTFQEVEMIRGFELALDTWSRWLESHVNSQKQKLFFMSLSPTHVWGEDWGASSNQNCYNETEPITKVGYMGRGTDPAMMKMAEGAIRRLNDRGVHVEFMNITQLSEYRKDAHPSIYRKFWSTLSQEQLENPSSYSDCTHWCLPGVPDVWNQLLYTFIFPNDL